MRRNAEKTVGWAPLIAPSRRRSVVRTGIASGVLALLFALASQPAAATTWRLGAIVGSSTDVNYVFGTTFCSAHTWVVAWPAVVGQVGDDVSFWHNATWWDNRSSGAPTATHTFTLDVNYDGDSKHADFQVPTTGNAHDEHTLNVTFTIRNLNRQAHINWSADITVGSPPVCTDYDSGYTWIWVART